MTHSQDTFQGLKAELLEIFLGGVGSTCSDETFNRMALKAFRFQCGANGPFGAFIKHRGVVPEAVTHWGEIPHLPTRAFKNADLFTGDSRTAEAVFRTSGTTRGGEERGRHLVRSLEIYRGSILPSFRAHVLPEGAGMPVLALLPDPVDAPESSLSFMIGAVKEGLCHGLGGYFATATGGVKWRELHRALLEAESRGEPVLLVGTAFAFVHWLEKAAEQRWEVRLPPESRLMETGGFKGRSRVLSREELYAKLERSFGIPTHRMINEYGMTELLSQFYEPVLGFSGVPGTGVEGRHHVGPPWVRTRVLDPLTLEPAPDGELGILAHYDLANLGSVCGVLTEDVGRAVPGGFQLRGRNPGAEPRGCSLAMEDFLGGLRGERYAL